MTPGPAPIAAPLRVERGAQVSMRAIFVVCLAIAGASLVILRQPAYDPSAWLIWGRELGSGSLDMIGGPSWKPLPVLFTLVFTQADDAAAPALWLLVARTGGFAAIALAFALARRLGGHRAGILAALGLALATDFLYNCLRGDSEGLLVALVLGAVSLHLHGHRHAALAAGLTAGLLRPEVWLLLAAYGVWLVRSDPRVRTVALTGAAAVALLALWFLPDYVSTGDLLRGAGRARHPVPGSPGQSAFPFGMTFVRASVFLCWPLYAGAIYAVARAWRGPQRSQGDRTVLALGAAAAGLMLVVALLAEAGFTGGLRYATLPGAMLCVVGALGLPSLLEDVRASGRRRLTAVALAAAVLAVMISVAVMARGGVRLAQDERVLGAQLDRVIARAGGAHAVRTCGQVAATRFERQALAWRLHLPSRDVWTHGPRRGTYFVRAGVRALAASGLPVRARLPGWTLRTSCPPG